MKSKDMIIKLKNLPVNTKEYIDEKTPIKILPYELLENTITGESLRVCEIDLTTLEGNSIYMCPPNTKKLDLCIRNKNNRLAAIYIDYSPNDVILTILSKIDKCMEFTIGEEYYCYYFATETEEYRLEKYPLYLMNPKNIEFIPERDYDGSTKKYVDDNINNRCLEEMPILRIDNNIVFIDINKMQQNHSYLIPLNDGYTSYKYIYTDETDNSETLLAIFTTLHRKDIKVYCRVNNSTKLDLVISSVRYSLDKTTKIITKYPAYYLSIGNTEKYTPTRDYHPSTKKYVDDSISEQITSSQATDEEVDAMLQTVLGGDYSNEQ